MTNLEILSEAQAAIVGSILIDASCLGDVLTRIHAEDFTLPRYRAIFEAARDLFNAGAPVDPVLIMDKAGGEAIKETLFACMDATPTAANVLHYCEVLRDQAGLYRLRQAAEKLAEAESLDDAREILDRAQVELSERSAVRSYTMTEIVADFLQRMSQPKPDYLHWGLGMIDGELHVDRSRFIIIGARPSTGKTALALQLCTTLAKDKRVGFYSLETSKALIGDRFGAANLGVTLPRIQARNFTHADMQALTYYLRPETGMPQLLENFEFIPAEGMTVAEIRTHALAKRFDVIFIDYVQLLRPTVRGERRDQMQDVSMALKSLSVSTNLVVVALAQLRRPENESRMKIPTLADLKESGQFEQDADAVLLMGLVEPTNDLSDRLLILAKNKEGRRGVAARFAFDGEHQRFTYVTKDGDKIPEAGKFEDLEDDGQMELPF